jgi:hypothetical protein
VKEEESDQIAAIPLVKRRRRRETNGKRRRKRDGFGSRFRQKLNYNRGRKLPVSPGKAARGRHWRPLSRTGIIFGCAAGPSVTRPAMTAMATALGCARLLASKISARVNESRLRHHQRNAEKYGKQTFHRGNDNRFQPYVNAAPALFMNGSVVEL